MNTYISTEVRDSKIPLAKGRRSEIVERRVGGGEGRVGAGRVWGLVVQYARVVVDKGKQMSGE